MCFVPSLSTASPAQTMVDNRGANFQSAEELAFEASQMIAFELTNPNMRPVTRNRRDRARAASIWNSAVFEGDAAPRLACSWAFLAGFNLSSWSDVGSWQRLSQSKPVSIQSP